eukprot:3695106-Pleurochrysis_carterae.AAC.2
MGLVSYLRASSFNRQALVTCEPASTFNRTCDRAARLYRLCVGSVVISGLLLPHTVQRERLSVRASVVLLDVCASSSSMLKILSALRSRFAYVSTLTRMELGDADLACTRRSVPPRAVALVCRATVPVCL